MSEFTGDLFLLPVKHGRFQLSLPSSFWEGNNVKTILSFLTVILINTYVNELVYDKENFIFLINIYPSAPTIIFIF